ncbi:protein with putative role during mitosis [Podochytrium sp. JEL0797]|nr:protein with putative role during mitosis [Podochytrium sp. JEL0797]
MATLTDKQKDELHLSILDYLNTAGLTAAFEAMQRETGATYLGDGQQKYSGLLERKWISVVRLQKKVMDLESKLAALDTTSPTSPLRKSAANPDFLPSLTPPPLVLAGHRGPVTHVALHPLFNTIASASEDATVMLFDYETGEYERTLKGHTKAVTCVAWEPEEKGGNLLATASADFSIKLWDGQNDYKCIRTLQGHDDAVSSVSFIAPRGDFLVSASRDKTIKIWEVATGYCVRTLYAHEEWVRMAVASEDGRIVASASNDHTIQISETSTGESLNQLQGHTHVVECVAFAPLATCKVLSKALGDKEVPAPGRYVASGSRDNSIRVWDTETGFCVMTLTGHDNWIRSLSFHPNAKYLLSVSDDKTLRVWDLSSSGKCVRCVENVAPQFLTSLDVHSRRAVVVCGSEDATVKVVKCV